MKGYDGLQNSTNYESRMKNMFYYSQALEFDNIFSIIGQGN